MVEAGKNTSLCANMGESTNGGVEVDDFESKVEVVEAVQAAVEDASEVSGADVAEEFEVTEVEGGVGGEFGGGPESGPVGVEAAVGEGVEVGRAGGGGGGGGKGEAEAAASARWASAECGGGRGSRGGAAGEADVEVGKILWETGCGVVLVVAIVVFFKSGAWCHGERRRR